MSPAASWRQRPRSEALQQAVDVVALELRAVAVAGPPAQLVDELLGALHVGLLGNLHVGGVDGADPVLVAAERIAPLVAGLLARAGAGLLLQLLHHGAGHVLGALLQLAERLRLRIDRLARL